MVKVCRTSNCTEICMPSVAGKGHEVSDWESCIGWREVSHPSKCPFPIVDEASGVDIQIRATSISPICRAFTELAMYDNVILRVTKYDNSKGGENESDPNAMYGILYLPKAPVMQADGQTQTAAIFHVARTAEAQKQLDNVLVTLEIELKVTESEAAQSFADRNGRGSKKNKNLVISFDTSSALSQLRVRALEGTVFDGRLADGRTTGTSETATGAIVDLSTAEQILNNVLTGGTRKPEHFKHHHVEALLPFAREFFKILEEIFGGQWLHPSPDGVDPFRKLYVHGWPFALKAIALAYHEARIADLAPIEAAMRSELAHKDATKTAKENFEAQLDIEKQLHAQKQQKAPITVEELKQRLKAIEWLRYRKHWIAITNHAVKKDGTKKTFKLKSTGEEKVVALAQNTSAVITAVRDKILSSGWQDLCATEDAPLT